MALIPYLCLLHLELRSVSQVLQGAAAAAPVVLTWRHDLMQRRRHGAEFRRHSITCSE